MNGVDWGDSATWAGVVVAAVFAGLARWQARRSRVDAQESAGDSKRSADAAERSATAAERLATLAETEATAYRVPWRIGQLSNSRYLLTNDGDETEFDVSVEGGFVLDSPVTRERVGPRFHTTSGPFFWGAGRRASVASVT